jgi:carbamoyl-phosphate synthase large subunit
MRIVTSDSELTEAFQELAGEGALAREGGLSAERPVLLDHFLEDAVEVDLDALRDSQGKVVIAGIMEHVEQAGVHSGDSACILPTQNLSDSVINTMIDYAGRIAKELEVIGLVNIQFAIQNNAVYVIEANPRASRTVPFVAKAIGVPIAKLATRVMLGEPLAKLAKIYAFAINPQGLIERAKHPKKLVAVKESVFAFNRFPNADTILGPEMKSTGEVMGIGQNFAEAFAKAQTASGLEIPSSGTIIITAADFAKPAILEVARDLQKLDFHIVATTGTAAYLQSNGLLIDRTVAKVSENDKDNIVQLLKNDHVALVIDIPNATRRAATDGSRIRRAAQENHVSIITSVSASRAIVQAIRQSRHTAQTVRALQS